MAKEITLQDLAVSLDETKTSLEKSIETTNKTVQDLAVSLDETKTSLEKSIETTNKTVENLAGIMHMEFGKIQQRFAEIDDQFTGVRNQFTGVRNQFTGVRDQFTEVRNQFTEVKEQIRGLDEKIDNTKNELSKKIEDEVENLAVMSKREFDQIGLRFNGVDNEFKEIHQELEQVNNNVVGLEIRVTKLEKSSLKS